MRGCPSSDARRLAERCRGRNRSRRYYGKRNAASAVTERTGRSVDVRCECGDVFALSVRRAFEHRRAGTSPRCRECRRPPLEMTAEEREKLQRWWLERSGLSLGELREIAAALGQSA